MKKAVTQPCVTAPPQGGVHHKTTSHGRDRVAVIPGEGPPGPLPYIGTAALELEPIPEEPLVPAAGPSERPWFLRPGTLAVVLSLLAHAALLIAALFLPAKSSARPRPSFGID